MMKTDNLRNLSHKKHYNGIPWCFHGDDQPNGGFRPFRRKSREVDTEKALVNSFGLMNGR